MSDSDAQDESPRAWSAILASTPVETADGSRVGAVVEVLGDQDEDIFHGIVLDRSDRAGACMIPAKDVRLISDRRIVIGLTGEEVKALPPYRPEESFRLGFGGLRHRLGWQREEGEDPK